MPSSVFSLHLLDRLLILLFLLQPDAAIGTALPLSHRRWHTSITLGRVWWGRETHSGNIVSIGFALRLFLSGTLLPGWGSLWHVVVA